MDWIARKLAECRIRHCLPIFTFAIIAILLAAVNAFPALYGDEYGSLSESSHLLGNLHAIGYLSHLYLWSKLGQSDIFLRLLSFCWFAAGIFWLNRWLKLEQLSSRTRSLVLWLALLNPFLWIYGLQVRFYAMFFSTSLLFLWRFRALSAEHSPRNMVLLLLSVAFMVASHLFGILVLATVLLQYAWWASKRNRLILLGLLVLGTIAAFLPATRLIMVRTVYRMTNNPVPLDTTMRGISLGMLAKVPMTLFFFVLGERIYPFWWWITIPAMLVMGLSLSLGFWQLRRLRGLASLVVLMLANIPLMFLVLDPIAPPGLQGAAPRYLIYTVPFFLLVLALGAQSWKPLKPLLIGVSLVGLVCLALPSWSYGGSDLINWPLYLNQTVKQPEETCIITDGRAQAPVSRYAPPGTRLALLGTLEDCSGFARIVLASSDYRLSQVRYFDQFGASLAGDYSLVSNVTMFPAQVTVYDKSPSGSSLAVASRLDLPEQDLRFPITIPERGWRVDGFTRLDSQSSVITLPLSASDPGSLWVLASYRAATYFAPGTPVLRLLFSVADDTSEVVLRAGYEISGWEGTCADCVSIYSWQKKLHLLGSYAYPGAYRQYRAHIWAYPLSFPPNTVPSSVTVTYLPDTGTGYFYGLYHAAE